MNVTGPLAIFPVQQTEDPALVLRLDQRVSADILQVSADSVTLALQGINVVARLSSPDQAAILAERRSAQFIIREINPNAIQLQLVTQAGETSTPIVLPAQSLAASLLTQAGLPVDGPRIQVLNAMLNQGMALDPEVLNKLLTILNQTGSWGLSEAEMAAAMLKANLPLTAASLIMAMNPPDDLGQALGQLLFHLKSYVANAQDSPELADAARQALAVLQKSLADWSAQPSALAENLKQAINLLGHSLEQELANQIQQGKQGLGEGGPLDGQPNGLLLLATLRREFARSGLNPELVDQIDRFLESLRFQNLNNADQAASLAGDRWASLEVPLQARPPVMHPPIASGDGAGNPTDELHGSRMRIAYKRDNEDHKIDPGYTRLVIQVDIDAGDVVEVDLSIVKQQVSARVTATNQPLCQLSEEEIPTLALGLASSGFDLRTSRCEVGEPKPAAGSSENRSSNLTLWMQNLDIGA